MKKFTVKQLSFPGAPDSLYQKGLQNLQETFGIETISKSKDIQILLFLTGGSEAEAIQFLQKDKFQLLIASGKANAYASATEVKGYSMQHGYQNKLFCMDDENDRKLFMKYLDVISALDGLKGKRLGLIGKESEWLVASGIDDNILLKKLGIELVRIAWEDIEDYKKLKADKEFLSKFGGASPFNLQDASRVHQLLRNVISDYYLDAVTIECFPLVKENGVTACLSLSTLNDLGIPAGCEGDLCSITGMMIAQQLFNEIPWMANLAGSNGNTLLLAHCTSPTSILDHYKINTHFETGLGTAIQGKFEKKEVCLFRLNSTLDKLFYSSASVTESGFKENACRTQMSILLPEGKMQELKNKPLGNHHLVLSENKTGLMDILSEVITG